MRRMSDSDIVISPEDRPGAWRPEAVKPAVEAKPRPKSRPARRARILDLSMLQKLALVGIAVIALVMGSAWLWHSGAPQRLGQSAVDGLWSLTARAGFKVEEITVTGRSRTGEAAIITALGVGIGDPILAMDLRAAKTRLEAIASVRAAAVERRLPGSLHVVIAERQPVALWQRGGIHVLIDRDGHPIPGSIEGFEDLPLVVGDGAPEAASDLLDMLATEPALGGRVKAAVRVGGRRWDLRLDDVTHGMEVKLPEEGADAAWHRLAGLEGDHGLTRRHVISVDLRLVDRMVIKTGGDHHGNGA